MDWKLVMQVDANNPNVGDLFLNGQPAITNIAAGSNGAILPQATIHVLSTAGFPFAGFFYIPIPGFDAPQQVNYTGLSGGNAFTGCTGGMGTLFTGMQVTCYQGTVRLTNSLSEEVAQEILVRMRFFQGEWFLDATQGIPWFQSILGQKTSLSIVTQILRTAVAQTPGVAQILSFVTSLTGRALALTFSVRLNNGQVLTSADFLNNPFVIPLNPVPTPVGTAGG